MIAANIFSEILHSKIFNLFNLMTSDRWTDRRKNDFIDPLCGPKATTWVNERMVVPCLLILILISSIYLVHFKYINVELNSRERYRILEHALFGVSNDTSTKPVGWTICTHSVLFFTRSLFSEMKITLPQPQWSVIV